MSKRATIADVAQHAGTSTASVSYVLNPGSRPVSDSMRSRVLASMEALDYRPDRNARALRQQSAWAQIGLIVPDVTLPLYGALVGHIERQGRARRALVMVANTGFDPAVELELVQSLIAGGVDGLIVCSASDSAAIERLCGSARLPVVWVHNRAGGVTDAVIGSDHVLAGRLATEHLTRHHHRRSVAFVGASTSPEATTGDLETVRDRHAGYLQEAGRSRNLIASDQNLADTYRQVRAALASRPPIDGLVIGTYSQSAAALRAVTDAGLQVPHDVAVVSFDGDVRNSYAQIVLSTVQQQVDIIAGATLDSALGATTAELPRQPVPVTMNPTESCGCSSSEASADSLGTWATSGQSGVPPSSDQFSR